MPDMHLFLTPKPDCPAIFCKHVEVRGRSYLVSEDGRVSAQSDSDFYEIHKLGPAASEARKATGWFQ